MRRIAAILGLCLAAGCSSPRMDGYIELLNAEKRALEDRLYDLTYEYEAQHRKLDRLIQENARLRQESGAAPRRSLFGTQRSQPPVGDVETVPALEPPVWIEPTDGPPTVIVPPDVERPSSEPEPPRRGGTPPADRRPQTTPPDDEDSSIPSVPALPVEEAEELPVRPAAAAAPASERPASEGAASLPAESAVPLRIDAAAIARDFDGQPGADGFELTLRPKYAPGQWVAPRGSLRVALLDGDDLDRRNIAAVWEFTAEELAQAAADPAARSAGLKLPMVWPAETPPAHSRVRIAVRLTADDGQTVDAQAWLVIDSAQWKARPDEVGAADGR